MADVSKDGGSTWSSIGFCGDCDPVKRHRVFNNGFATNGGGDKPPNIRDV